MLYIFSDISLCFFFFNYSYFFMNSSTSSSGTFSVSSTSERFFLVLFSLYHYFRRDFVSSFFFLLLNPVFLIVFASDRFLPFQFSFHFAPIRFWHKIFILLSFKYMLNQDCRYFCFRLIYTCERYRILFRLHKILLIVVSWETDRKKRNICSEILIFATGMILVNVLIFIHHAFKIHCG